MMFGAVGMGAQRWIDLGFMRLQPSELTKITLVMILAAYYDWLDLSKKSRPLYVLIPLAIIAIPVFIYGREGLRKQGEWRAEYLMLALFAILGMMIMISANGFALMIVAFSRIRSNTTTVSLME